MQATQRQAVLSVVRALLPTWRSGRIEGVTYLPGGYANDNYRFEYGGAAYALRIARHPGADRRAEARFLALASAPDVVAFDLPRGHLLTRWIDGTLLAESPVPPETAAAYLRALHAEIPRGVRRYDPREAIRRDLAAAPAPVALAAVDRLGWTPTDLRGCHNDLNPWNVLRTERGWRTLDWEFAGDNDPLFDVVCLGRGLDYDDSRLERLAAAYYGTSPVPVSRILDTRILFELREYAWAVRQVALGNDRAEIRAQADTAERALRDLRSRWQFR